MNSSFPYFSKHLFSTKLAQRSALTILLLALFSCQPEQQATTEAPQPAAAALTQVDTILSNGKIVTVDGQFSIQDTLVIDEGRIVAVGDASLLQQYQAENQVDLAGKTVVVSAGGTHEPIDPVRVVANRSSGKMGYAIAEAARDRGANVVLVAGPTTLADPVGIQVVNVETAAQMHDAVLSACNSANALIKAAAVADYRPVGPSAQKLKKADQTLHVDLEPTVDIIAAAPRNIVRVGFAAESTDLLANAKAKLQQKGLDLIAANDITHEGSGFGADTNQVTLLDPQGGAEELPLLPKYDVAWRLLDRVVSLLQDKGQPVAS